MTNQEKNKHVQERLKAHYNYIESLGYEIIGIFLQGSQNYNLDIYDSDYMSDVDTKCIVLPTLSELVKGTHMVSTKYDFEGEQIDVKDIRVMMEVWRKQNQSYLEILFTDYKIINPKYKVHIKKILDMKNDIVKMNLPQLARCIRGMSAEKVAALEHEYPSTKDRVKKFGYDPKQLASIIRLTHLSQNFFINNLNFKDSILYKNDDLRKYMIDIKKGVMAKKEAEDMASIYDSQTSNIKNNIVEKYGKDFFDNEIYEKLKNRVYSLVEYGIKSNIAN